MTKRRDPLVANDPRGKNPMQTHRTVSSSASSLLAAACLTAFAGAGNAAESVALTARPFASLPGLTADAARKIDPRILLTMAQPRKTPDGLKEMGKRLPILGTSATDLRFPVLIRSSLSDRELAALGAPPDSRAGDITTAEVDQNDLVRLASDPRLQVIEASYWLEPTLDVSVPEIRAPQVWNGSPGFNGEGVLVGLLDDGVDVNHQDFLDDQSHSRIEFIWDHFREGAAPSGFNYGKEYTRAQIDANQADEFQDTGGHGAHVASTAMGDGSSNANKYRGVAWKAGLVAVRNGYCDLFCYGGGVPPWGNSSSKGSIDGLNYLLQKKTALGKPMVVNQSQGVMMGPHDGTTLLEQAYNNLVTNNGLIICIAAGNDEEAGWHGRKTVGNGQTVTFQMAHTQDNGGGVQAFLNYEAWTKQGDRCHWRLTTPSNETLDIDATTQGNDVLGVIAPAHQDTIFFFAAADHAVNHQGYLSIAVQNRRQGAATGVWKLDATAEQVTAGGQVDVYLERNQFNFTVTGDALNTDGIVGMPGTATGAITVASYTTKISWASQDGTVGPNPPPTVGAISSFSSWGPRRDGAQKPDISAPGEWIMAVKAAEHQQAPNQTDPDGKHMIISGTSMATPHVTGVIALMLQKKPNLTPTEAKTTLAQTARHDGFTGQGWNKQFGNGKVDAKAAVDALGGASNCATRSGDANQDNAVNVLDLVATVNDILGTTPLGTGRSCADINGDNQIRVDDVVSIVNLILAGLRGGSDDLALSNGDAVLDTTTPLAWAESIDASTFRFAFEAGRVGGVQMTYILPRGYEASGQPRLIGAAPGTSIQTHEANGQTMLVAYSAKGSLAQDS
ncbi:MAG: S8 family serine peptidase [Candidatus Eisenbacteria bacterium]